MAKKVEVINICFDASIRNGVVGIGIFNTKWKGKEYHSFNYDGKSSLTAETMALALAMEYARKNQIEKPRFITDNKQLSTNGIPEHFLLKYGYTDFVELVWVPRELNTEADKLSKAGSACTASSCVDTEMGVSIDNVVYELIKKYSFKRRLEFIKRMANSNQDFKLVKFLNGKGYGGEMPKPEDIMLIRVARTIFARGDITKNMGRNLDKLLKGYTRNPLCEEEFDVFVRARNLI